MWAAKLPLKIKIFSWHLAIDRLPSSLNIANRYEPANNRCALCGQPKDASHIHFLCSIAKFAWSAIRQLLGCNWCPASFAQAFAIMSGFSGHLRRKTRILFIATFWAPWLIRNKLTMVNKVIKHSADVIFKIALSLRMWSPLFKPADKARLEEWSARLRRISAESRLPSATLPGGAPTST